jgi:hypothetical protein
MRAIASRKRRCCPSERRCYRPQLRRFHNQKRDDGERPVACYALRKGCFVPLGILQCVPLGFSGLFTGVSTRSSRNQPEALNRHPCENAFGVNSFCDVPVATYVVVSFFNGTFSWDNEPWQRNLNAKSCAS